MPNGGFGLAQKGTHKGAKMGPKKEPKWRQIWPQKGAQNGALFGGRIAPKPFEFLVFWLKMPPRRGAIFSPKVDKLEPKWSPKWTKFGSNMDQNGPRIHRNRSLFEIGQKGGVRKSLENLLGNLLVQ